VITDPVLPPVIDMPCGCEEAGVSFCNFDYGVDGFCEDCSDFVDVDHCYNDGLPEAGANDCAFRCFSPHVDPVMPVDPIMPVIDPMPKEPEHPIVGGCTEEWVCDNLDTPAWCRWDCDVEASEALAPGTCYGHEWSGCCYQCYTDCDLVTTCPYPVDPPHVDPIDPVIIDPVLPPVLYPEECPEVIYDADLYWCDKCGGVTIRHAKGARCMCVAPEDPCR